MKTNRLENLLFGTLTLALTGCVGIKTQNDFQSGSLDPNGPEGMPPLKAYLMNDTNAATLATPPETPASSDKEHQHGKEAK